MNNDFDKKKVIEALELTKKALEALAKEKITEAARKVDELKKKVSGNG